uniref:Uncharacterized protein n=1 Tax=Solanum lycopersicum TaxID=4081 RepID=A0A3Q7H4X7_SOLLC
MSCKYNIKITKYMILKRKINNVGTNIWKPTTEYTGEDYAHMMATNLESSFHLNGIRVNGVAPWFINTPLVEQVLGDKEFLEGVISRTTLKRPGEVEEVSLMVAYLCLPSASYVTGQVIAVDGGFTLLPKVVDGHLMVWLLSSLVALVELVVEELAGLGAKVYTCCKTESELDEPMQDWAERGIQVKGSACDVTCRDQRVELMKKVSSEFDGKLNILINNVGTNIWKHSIDYNAEDYAHMMATNLESSFHFSQLAHPLLKSSGSGSIVFTASVAGLVHVSGTSIYGATKAGMIQLTRNLACEWGRDGIRVNAVAPCYTNTPLVKHLLKDKEFSDALISRVPLGRSGEVEEVSSLIAYLCLPGASYVTGQIIAVDGGFTVYGFQQPGY